MSSSHVEDIRDLLSIIYLSDGPDCPQGENGRIREYLLPAQPSFCAGIFQKELIRSCGSNERDPIITTPWVLFLEPDEEVKPEELASLADACRKRKNGIFQITVERLLPKDAVEPFSWVTTEGIWKNPPGQALRYLTRESRLVFASLLDEIKISAPPHGSDCSFLIQLDGQAAANCPALLSRQSRPVSEPKPRPADRDMFIHGHQKYTDDTLYSARFGWPHTVYHTLRFDHVPGIIKALKAGLSNPEILIYALIYLLRFRHFQPALEIINMVPEHWYTRYPDLANAAATVHFVTGSHDKALKINRNILKAYPDSNWIARNAIKLNILTGHYNEIDAIIARYREATGKELDDSYYGHFMSVHGKNPEKTATLSICMIVRDEEETIERAITSVKQLADEIIVVDTGSGDATAEIAESLGARVYHLPWPDDFSAARNYAVSKATGDYIFMLDADESISPFFYMESQTLKKLFPLNKMCAYELQIGTYFNETDWLFITAEQGNFRVEDACIRIFPRLPGVQYAGCIAETLRPALEREGIPIVAIPEQLLQIVHEHGRKKERTERKAHLYARLENPGEEAVLSAIRDYSFIGCQDETLNWLTSFFAGHTGAEGKIRMGLRLAALLERSSPTQAGELYRQILNTFPESLAAVRAYAEHLINSNQIAELGRLSLESVAMEISAKEEREFECLRSLKYFVSGEMEEAFQVLAQQLNEDLFQTFPQAVRFFYLASMQDIEGAVSSMDILFELAGVRKSFRMEKIEDFFSVSEELCAMLLREGYRKESALVLYGLSNMGNAREVS